MEFHGAFLPEFDALAEPVKDALLAHSRLLQEFGPTLGRPAVDTVKGSVMANLKEFCGSTLPAACGGFCSRSMASGSRYCRLRETRQVWRKLDYTAV